MSGHGLATAARLALVHALGQAVRGAHIPPDAALASTNKRLTSRLGQGWLTDNGSSVICDTDVDGGETLLTSNILDISTLDDPYICYARWYSNASRNSPEQDVFATEVSENAGAPWVPMETVGPDGAAVQGGWVFRTSRIADLVTPTELFRIRFRASDVGGPSAAEAAVDAFELLEFDCGVGCHGDLNGDNHVGLQDLAQLAGNHGVLGGAQYTDGDSDEDGDVDLADLAALLGVYGTTCERFPRRVTGLANQRRRMRGDLLRPRRAVIHQQDSQVFGADLAIAVDVAVCARHPCFAIVAQQLGQIA